MIWNFQICFGCDIAFTQNEIETRHTPYLQHFAVDYNSEIRPRAYLERIQMQ